MPKEYIHSENHGRRVPVLKDGSDETETGKYELMEMDRDSIKLSWSKADAGGAVQIAVLDYDKDVDGFDARHISLDRHGINRLIRFLRRARDDAFGKDE